MLMSEDDGCDNVELVINKEALMNKVLGLISIK